MQFIVAGVSPNPDVVEMTGFYVNGTPPKTFHARVLSFMVIDPNYPKEPPEQLDLIIGPDADSERVIHAVTQALA